MKALRYFIIGIPLLVVLLVGALLGLVADLSEWNWAQAAEESLRGLATELWEDLSA